MRPPWLVPMLLVIALACFYVALGMRDKLFQSKVRLSPFHRLKVAAVTLLIMVLLGPGLWKVTAFVFGVPG